MEPTKPKRPARQVSLESFQKTREEFMMEVRSKLDVVYIGSDDEDPQRAGKSFLRVVAVPTFT